MISISSLPIIYHYLEENESPRQGLEALDQSLQGEARDEMIRATLDDEMITGWWFGTCFFKMYNSI